MSPDRRVDLALPDSVPVGDLMAQLLDLCTDHHDRTGALAWTLRPVGGTGLAWASSLATARVRDGAVLELTPRSTTRSLSTVEDVRDATEDAVDQGTGRWTSAQTATVAVLTSTTLAWVVLVIPHLWVTSSGNGLPVCAAVGGGALWAGVRVAGRGFDVAAHALIAVGLAWIGALVIAATGPAAAVLSTLTPANRAALTAAAVVGAAVVVTRVMPGLAVWSAAAVVIFVAALGWAVTDLAGGSPDEAIALGTVLGVLSLGIAPRTSLAAGGLAQLDYVVRTRGCVDPGLLAATFARSRALLTGSLIAVSGLTAAGSVRLEHSAGSALQVAQAAAIAACLILRSRAFSQRAHVMIMVVPGTAALLAQLTSDLVEHSPRPTTLVGLALITAGSVGLARASLTTPSDVTAARSRRLLDVIEWMIVAALVPLLAANLGVLEWVRELVT
ncbi:MAG: type VII secretion integral membrane protein EccD [Actinomycetota bacterium]|nr:type VII secretion integral membrane protein EccD [Actinomycetota bacterium]